MNTYQQGFRSEILNTIFHVSGKTWLKVTVVNAIMTIVAVIAFFVGFASVIFANLELFNQNMTNFSEILAAYESIVNSLFDTTGKMISFIIILIVIGITGSWAYCLVFNLTDSQIKNDRINFGELFGRSFNPVVFQVMLAGILIYVVLLAGIGIGVLLASISGFLTFLVILFILIFINRFILVVPALIIGKLSLTDAFAFSYRHISLLRALKIFGILFIAGIAMFLVALLVGLISGLFALIPILGQIIQFAINIGFNGFVMALTVSAITGLYYRYLEDIEDTNEKLEIDDLLVSE